MNDIKKMKNNPDLKGLARICPDITFSKALPEGIKMTIITPQYEEHMNVEYPCVVFVQGSAWTFPDINYEIPQLCQLASKGYVVATITHRNSLEGHAFPACLIDVKTAIRFMRANAKAYHINADKIGIWGTSSGGNLSLLSGLNIDNPKYKSKEYADYSDKVNFVVDCFGPTDIELREDALDENILSGLCGGNPDEHIDILKEISPVNHVVKGKIYPPFLILHGDKDDLIPYSQSLRMYNILKEGGADVEMICIEDAPHEGNFWSQEVLNTIFDFIKRTI